MPNELDVRQTIDKRLLDLAGPNAVYDWLKARRPNLSLPLATVQSLLARNEPLVGLGIAEFCSSPNALKSLFREGDDAVRCAVLSNHALGREFFAEDEHPTFVRDAPDRELRAYLSNPGLDPEVMEALFLQQPPFDSLQEGGWMQCTGFAAFNPFLQSEYRYSTKYDLWEPFREIEHDKPLKAAWGLVDSVPATESWALTLVGLYAQIAYRRAPQPSDADFLRALLSKWRLPEEPADGLNWYGELRRTIASKVPINDHDDDGTTLLLRDSDDRFIRMGYYEQFQPWDPAEVRAGYSRDGKYFLRAAVENDWFYQRHVRLVRTVFHNLIHQNRELDPSDWANLAKRYEERAETLGFADPTRFPRYEPGYEDEVRSKEEKRRARSHPTLGDIGERLGLVAYDAISRNDPAGVARAMFSLRDELDSLEDRLEGRFVELVKALRDEIAASDKPNKSRFSLLLWLLAVGFAVLLFAR